MALAFLAASNVTRVEAGPTNNLTPEQIEAIATEMFNRFAAFDAQGTADMFAPDGTIEDPVGSTPIQGTQAIIAYQQTFPTILNEIRIQSFDVTVAGQECAIKWRLRFKTKTGNVFFVDGIGILKSTSREKFNPTESTLTWRIFSRNCSNKWSALVARSGPLIGGPLCIKLKESSVKLFVVLCYVGIEFNHFIFHWSRLMKWLWTSLAVVVFSTLATAQQIKISGRLITDTGEPVANTRVRVEGGTAHTDANGRFNILMSSKVRDGMKITIVIEKKNWLINQPLDGEWNLIATDPQTLEVIITPLGSKALWTSARIEKELKLKSEAIDLDVYIEELARKYGCTQQVTKEALEKWAATQNNTANTLKDQGRSVDGPEAVRLLGEAASAYRRALLVFTRESMPLEWATTQHNLGFALQEQGARAKAPEATRLLAESVAAYRQALTIRTREQLPRQWATTQNDLGNALQGQGTRAEGVESIRLLSEAADAYGQALLFFTREYAPLDWSMTQHNLGSALHERGTRTEGLEAQSLLREAVAAYRLALIVRTREQLPALWAVTQNNLGNALQAQAMRATNPENLRLLDEAVTAYRQALLVFTREQRPQMWAMTKHNLGSALQEEGTRSQGPDANRLFAEAVTAYQEALLVWTREQRPHQWAMAQNNLARAYFNLKEWNSAAQLYENVLEVHPDFQPAYERARFLEHEVLFNYQRAFKLSQSWLQRNPGDLSAAADVAEKLFTTGSFEESDRQISLLLSDVRVEPATKIALLAIDVANLVALEKSTVVWERLKNLVDLLETQPASFKLQRSFEGTKHFINQSQQLVVTKDWLLQMFRALAGENRYVIVKELRVLYPQIL